MSEFATAGGVWSAGDVDSVRRYRVGMGLVNARNLRRAKQLLEKNRHRVGGVVEKAGEQLDKVSNGKTTNVTAKAAGAARTYSEGSPAHPGPRTEGEPVERPDPSGGDADADAGGTDASGSAATAVKGAADAFTNFLNKAAAKAEAKNAGRDDTDPTKT